MHPPHAHHTGHHKTLKKRTHQVATVVTLSLRCRYPPGSLLLCRCAWVTPAEAAAGHEPRYNFKTKRLVDCENHSPNCGQGKHRRSRATVCICSISWFENLYVYAMVPQKKFTVTPSPLVPAVLTRLTTVLLATCLVIWLCWPTSGVPVLAHFRFSSKTASKSSSILVFAFYYPQFHPFPENDAVFGVGFTEWTNVRAAPERNFWGRPIRRPTELGYYDLRDYHTRKRQGQLAAQHGIDGFFIYHYWLDNRVVMGAVTERLMQVRMQ